MGIKGLPWRIGVSIFLGFAWLAFLIIWLFFYAGDYSVFQNIAIFLASILVLIGILGAMWASWGLKFAKKYGGMEPKQYKQKVPSVLSGVIGIGWLIFLIIWLYSYASGYDPYQNLAIILVSILVAGGAMGAIWAVWGMKFAGKFS